MRLPVAGGVINFSFKNWQFLPRLYDNPNHQVLLRCGRQVGKSLTVSNVAFTYTTMVPNFRTLIVHPSAMQSKMFSEDRLHLPIMVSPKLRAFYPGTRQSVFHKRSVGGSSIILRYAFLSAARLRGIPADMVVIDELQDILRDHIPVIEQVTFHSPFKIYYYCGTPMTEENVIESYWQEMSTQCEWVIPCRRHGTPKDRSSWRWNVISDKNIGSRHLICDKCGRQIDPQDPDCQWAAMQDRRGKEEIITWEGFRIPQPIIHFMKEEHSWKELRRKRKQYPIAQYYNEVLALPYSSGIQPITKSELREVADAKIRFEDIDKLVVAARGNLYAGVDWGEGQAKAYTLVTLGGYLPPDPKFKILYCHRFEGLEADPRVNLRQLVELFHHHDVRHIGTDYGGGFYPNSVLQSEFGNRVHIYQYVSRQRSGKVVFNPKLGWFTVSRNDVMSDILTALKRGKITLPSWEDFDPWYSRDILAIRQAYNYQLRYIQYDKIPDRSDDTFHSILYCFLASWFDRARPDILHPQTRPETGEQADILDQMEEASQREDMPVY